MVPMSVEEIAKAVLGGEAQPGEADRVSVDVRELDGVDAAALDVPAPAAELHVLVEVMDVVLVGIGHALEPL